VSKHVYDTLNISLASHLDSRLMAFHKINNCFTLLINLEIQQHFVHLFKKILTLLMFKGVEKILMYQHIINVSINF
jgi:hypothetical protein